MIIGHKKQREFLDKIIKEGSRSLLFTGPESVGKKTIALDFLSSIFQAPPSKHPDFLLVEPLKGQIKIDQIRNLSERISLKPVKSSSFGVVIDQAHLMNRAAQNCFLKTLEEPKSSAVLILVTKHPDFLLSTISSRCERIKFYPVKRKKLRNYLEKKNVTGKKAEKIINISLGKPGKVINYLENPEKLENRKEIINELIEIMDAPLSDRFDYVKDLSKKDDLKEVLVIWLSYLRKKIISEEGEDLLKLKEILNSIQETIYLITNTNTSLKLALEALVIKF